jgi:uroporphyrinogen III methyltransferase/synthase
VTPVLFTGAGPGDPELLTVKARSAILAADIVFHDELVPAAIHEMARQARPYRGIEELIEAARQNLRVVRLQAGDPAIFGRLAEQMQALRDAGIPFAIIPGVTAACAAAAEAQVSLTHGALGRTVALVSAHDPSAPVPDADTVVYYMGRPSRPGPVIAVQDASRPQQRISRDPATLAAPSIIIHGAVADLASLPLFGQRVVTTRAEASGMSARLRLLGAEVIEYPVIEILPPEDPGPLAEAAAEVSRYDWILFTSANGVRAFFSRVSDLRRVRAKIGAIGPATAAELAHLKLPADLVPAEYVAEGVLDALPRDLTGIRMLLPRAAVARDVLPEELRSRGAAVDVVAAYRTVIPRTNRPAPVAADWVTFTSSSTVKNYLALAGTPPGKAASIGPITSATLRQHGIEPAVEAAPYTTDGLVEAIRKACGR